MKQIAIVVLAAFLTISSASGDQIAQSYIGRQISSHVKLDQAEKVAEKLRAVFQALLSNEMSGEVANEEIYALFSQNFSEALLLITTANMNDEARSRYIPAYAKHANKLAPTLDYFSDTMYDVSGKISEDTQGSVNIDSFVQQATSLDEDAVKAGLLPKITQENAVAVFFDYSYHIRGLRNLLGYDGIVDLFGSSDAEKAKSIKFAKYFDTLSPQSQLLLYAWIYDPSFEDFLSGSETPDDLPPWITSKSLKKLHLMVNRQRMGEFRKREAEMTKN